MEATFHFRLLINYAKRNNTVRGSSTKLRCYKSHARHYGPRDVAVCSKCQLSNPHQGDIQIPAHSCHLRSFTAILCGFTTIISNKRPHPTPTPPGPQYNQHRVFCAQTVTEAADLISCKITFRLYRMLQQRPGRGRNTDMQKVGCFDGTVTGVSVVSGLHSLCSSVTNKSTSSSSPVY